MAIRRRGQRKTHSKGPGDENTKRRLRRSCVSLTQNASAGEGLFGARGECTDSTDQGRGVARVGLLFRGEVRLVAVAQRHEDLGAVACGGEGRQGAMDSKCGGKRVDGGGVRGSEGGGARDGGGAWRRARAGGGSRFGGRSVGGARRGDGGGPRRRGRAGRGSRFGEESHTRGAFGGKGGGAASGTALEAGDFFKARSFSLFALLSFFSFVFFTSANTPPSPPVCRRSEERRCREGEGVGIGGDGEAQGKACR